MYYENFARLCEKNGVKPSTVSKATGISTATLTSWKQGKYTPKQDKLQLSADFFHVSIDYLMSGISSDAQYVLLDENVDLVMEIVHRIHDDKGFLERMTKYIELITRGNTVIDEMIDFQYDKQKKAGD